MQYPLITEYIEAIQYSESFESADLQALRPVLDANGRPMMTSGNFAVVFKMQNQQTGAEYALKCFTQDQEGRAEAYRQIMAELRYVDSPYFIDFEYIEEAVWAGDFDCAFPAVLMPWVDGEPLDQHIRRLVNEEPDRLQLVAYKFSVMASWLVNQPFAHGDLKPDNILVRQDGSMVLVDYDGIYVPSMRGMTSREAGTPAFRHPNRVNMAFDEYIDDFALATINLSLYLIALKPSLLQTHGAKDRLLFSDDDYRNIAASRIIGEISQLSYDAQLQRLYALFLIALSEGSLQRCENRLMLLAPPQQEFVIVRYVYTKKLNDFYTSYFEDSWEFETSQEYFNYLVQKLKQLKEELPDISENEFKGILQEGYDDSLQGYPDLIDSKNAIIEEIKTSFPAESQRFFTEDNMVLLFKDATNNTPVIEEYTQNDNVKTLTISLENALALYSDDVVIIT